MPTLVSAALNLSRPILLKRRLYLRPACCLFLKILGAIRLRYGKDIAIAAHIVSRSPTIKRSVCIRLGTIGPFCFRRPPLRVSSMISCRDFGEYGRTSASWPFLPPETVGVREREHVSKFNVGEPKRSSKARALKLQSLQRNR